MTTLNKPARTHKEVVADLQETLGSIEGDESGTHVVWATLSVALDWMADDDGEPSTEWNWMLDVLTEPLGAPQVNAQGEAVHALKFEYAYNYADWVDRSDDYDDVDR